MNQDKIGVNNEERKRNEKALSTSQYNNWRFVFPCCLFVYRHHILSICSLCYQPTALGSEPGHRRHISPERHSRCPKTPPLPGRICRCLHKPWDHLNHLGRSPCHPGRVRRRPWIHVLMNHRIVCIGIVRQLGQRPA